jgi:hypothetical protein
VPLPWRSGGDRGQRLPGLPAVRHLDGWVVPEPGDQFSDGGGGLRVNWGTDGGQGAAALWADGGEVADLEAVPAACDGIMVARGVGTFGISGIFLERARVLPLFLATSVRWLHRVTTVRSAHLHTHPIAWRRTGRTPGERQQRPSRVALKGTMT